MRQDPIEIAKTTLTKNIAVNILNESKTDSDILSGVYLGHDAKGYQFRTGNGGTAYATVLSTTEPSKGEGYILVRSPGTDTLTAKPKPRL